MKNLGNKNIIVTGASGGIGNAIIKKLNEDKKNLIQNVVMQTIRLLNHPLMKLFFYLYSKVVLILLLIILNSSISSKQTLRFINNDQ